MRKVTALALVAFALSTCAVAKTKPAQKSAPRSTQQFGNVLMEAETFTYAKPDKITALGNVDLRGKDKASSTDYTAHASKIIVTLGKMLRAQGTGSPLGAIRSADLIGPVMVTYTTPKIVIDPKTKAKSEVATKTVVKSDNATIDGAEDIAHFIGNVVITYFDPSVMEEPTVTTCEKAAVNLNPNPTSDEFVFKVETPGGQSKVDITLKNEAQKEK